MRFRARVSVRFFKRIQRHIDEQILTVLLVLTEETFSTCCNCILILLSMKSSCMRCYLFREPNKTCIFWHLSNDCQIACPVACVARGRFFLFFFLLDSAAPKLNHRFLFRPWFIFRALCEPPNKNTPQNRQLRRLLVLHLFPVPQTGSHIQDKHVIDLVFFGQCCKLPILIFSIDLSVCNLQYGPKPRLILKRYLLPSRVWYLLGKVSLHVFHPTLVCHNFEQGQLARARLQDRRRCWNSLRGLYHRSSRRSSYSNRS